MLVGIVGDNDNHTRIYEESDNRRFRAEVWDSHAEKKLGEFFVTTDFMTSSTTDELDALVKYRIDEILAK